MERKRETSAIKPGKVNRRVCREFVMQVLYAYDLRKEEKGESVKKICEVLLPDAWKENMEYKNFVFRYIERYGEVLEQAESLIKQHALHWDFERVSIIDRIVIAMAVSEFLKHDEIPIKVSMNEAIEIVKKYSTDQSATFVNGVLHSIHKTLVGENAIHKVGRGLISFSIKCVQEGNENG